MKTRQHDLTIKYQGLVRSIAWKIHRKVGRHAHLEDLISYGQVGLLEAAREFDEARGVNFTTYAYYRIRGAILGGLSKMSWFSHADYHRGRYEQRAEEALDEPKTSSDCPESLNSTVQKLSVVYLFCQLSTLETSGLEFTSSDEEPHSQCDRQELLKRVRVAIMNLPDQERQLILFTYYDNCSLSEAGRRIGISRAWASRMHARAIGRIAAAIADRAGYHTFDSDEQEISEQQQPELIGGKAASQK